MSSREDTRLVDFLYGELPAKEAAEYRRELEADPKAREELEQYEEMLGTLRAVEDEEPSPHLDSLMLARARAATEERNVAGAAAVGARGGGWLRRLLEARWAGVAIAGSLAGVVAVVLGTATLTMRSRPDSQQLAFQPVSNPSPTVTASPIERAGDTVEMKKDELKAGADDGVREEARAKAKKEASGPSIARPEVPPAAAGSSPRQTVLGARAEDRHFLPRRSSESADKKGESGRPADARAGLQAAAGNKGSKHAAADADETAPGMDSSLSQGSGAVAHARASRPAPSGGAAATAEGEMADLELERRRDVSKAKREELAEKSKAAAEPASAEQRYAAGKPAEPAKPPPAPPPSAQAPAPATPRAAPPSAPAAAQAPAEPPAPVREQLAQPEAEEAAEHQARSTGQEAKRAARASQEAPVAKAPAKSQLEARDEGVIDPRNAPRIADEMMRAADSQLRASDPEGARRILVRALNRTRGTPSFGAVSLRLAELERGQRRLQAALQSARAAAETAGFAGRLRAVDLYAEIAREMGSRADLDWAASARKRIQAEMAR